MRLGSSIRRRRGAKGSSDDGVARDRLRFVGTAALITLVGFGGGWLVATRLLFPAPPPPGDLFEVPDVRGESPERAAESLEAAGLDLGEIDGLRHPTADSGLVVGQAPLPGQLALPGASVRLTVSLGSEQRPVPDIERLRADRARNVLEATGFSVRVDSVDDALPRGRVVEIDPPPGTELSVPGDIRMVVSRGPPTVLMPEVLGLTEAQARDTLSALGLAVGGVEEVFRFGREQGLVVEQAPPAGVEVERGSAVRLSVGRRSGGGSDADTPSDTTRGNNEADEP